MEFYNHTSTGAELNYDIHEKDLLAIFESLKTCRYYLELTHDQCKWTTRTWNILLLRKPLIVATCADLHISQV